MNKVEGASPKHVLKMPKIVPKSQPKVNIASISVENVWSWKGQGEERELGLGGALLCPQLCCLLFPAPHDHAELTQLGFSYWPPQEAACLCHGLPCPSSDSSWQLQRNVLLTAVFLINGEHVCVAETLFFFFFFLLLFGGNTVKLFISTIKVGGEGGLLSSYPKGFLYLRSAHFRNRHFSNPWVSFPKCFHTSAPLCPAFLPYHHLVLMRSSSLQHCQVLLFF